MNRAQTFHVELNSAEQLLAYFLAATVTAAVLSVWSAVTRTAQAVVDLVRGRR
jgi:hypothetical protein